MAAAMRKAVATLVQSHDGRNAGKNAESERAEVLRVMLTRCITDLKKGLEKDKDRSAKMLSMIAAQSTENAEAIISFGGIRALVGALNEGGDSLLVCKACPEDSVSAAGSTSPADCLCAKTFYRANVTAEGLPVCSPCPSAATDCLEIGWPNLQPIGFKSGGQVCNRLA